jgi:hypothetical protein
MLFGGFGKGLQLLAQRDIGGERTGLFHIDANHGELYSYASAHLPELSP